MLGPNRIGRVGDLIRAEVVEILRRRVKDPRVAEVTVTAVAVSADLRHAKVFVSLLQDAQMTRALAGLNRAAGFIRGELGRRLRMRLIPELSFHPDATIERAERIQFLLDQLSQTSDSGELERDHQIGRTEDSSEPAP